MIKNLIRWYRVKFPRKIPKGAPNTKQFARLTLAERKAIKLNVKGKNVLVIDLLKQNAKKMPEMHTFKDGKKHKVNHEKELIQTYLFCGFIGIYNYLKAVRKAEELGRLMHEAEQKAEKLQKV